ncbi:MAG TPA: peptidylprolyl isomerase [Candidatus Angelobacter sp.]|jgi:peptidyl-prolyl cis-trans isomerase SurA|nr:peptidylprolyl isomerase [Candidatus Angelobacter sp.]
MLKKLSLLASAVVLLVAGLRADNIVDEIIARVNNQIITRSDMEKAKQTNLEELKQRFPSDWQAKWTKAQNDILRDLIDQQLLLARGDELGITGQTEVVKRLNQLRQQMNLASIDDLEAEAKKQGVSYEDFKEQIRISAVTQQVIGQEVGGKIHISNEDIQDWYNKHQKELEGPEEVGLSEIMIATQPARQNVEDKDKQAPAQNQDKQLPEDPAKVAEAQAKANQILDQLKKGAKFEDLAKKSSDGPTASQGGSLGNFKRGELAKDLEDKTFSLKAGENTDVIRTRQGFIILKVTGHRPAGVPPVKDISDRIREAIYSERLEPAARAFLTKLREQAYIDIKSGYSDTGASPNQGNKPVVVAAANENGNRPGKPPKKKKKFLVF